MAKRKHDDDLGEWPEGEQSEEETGELRKPEPPPFVSERPKFISVPTDQGVTQVSTDVDMTGYEGEYKYLVNGLICGLKVVEDDPRGRTHKLLCNDLFWEGNAEEFRKAFEKQ